MHFLKEQLTANELGMMGKILRTNSKHILGLGFVFENLKWYTTSILDLFLFMTAEVWNV